ncbi:MAG: DUF5928 domain-containing protein [Pikeienuella sp.]|uniref:DUF5928 domain-containing protein n=1 Tax=Pikeienuella sp. TaxID=2831957 RepID=UPI00391B5A49
MDVKIAFLLLCHRDAEGVVAQARALLAAGDAVAIHFDRNGEEAEFAKLREAFAAEPNVAFAKRVACGWGEFSLCQATLNLIEAARSGFSGVTHYYLLSGDCLPTKPAAHLRAALAGHDRDFIEINDFLEGDWIKTGLKEERLIYRHWFNERKQKRLFYGSMAVQKRLGLARRPPEGLRAKIGSQWWLLRARTVERMLAFLEERPEVKRFFRTTWIPDETMFQTIAFHSAPVEEIASHPPTTLIFSDYGMPVVFHRDHEARLLAEPRFFARKITSFDPAFRRSLLDLYAAGDGAAPGPERIGAQYAYLAGRGRIGRRQGERFWSRGATLDDGKEVLLIAAKKWHVGRHAAEAAGRAGGFPALGYVFDEEGRLPFDLGGLEAGKDKRGRHRRAFLGLMFDALGVSRLALCIDPSRDDVARDFAATDCRMRILCIETPFTPAEYEDHARRVGLLGAGEGGAALVSALEAEFAEEATRLRAAAPGAAIRAAPGMGREEIAIAVARFLRAGPEATEAMTREIEPFLTGESHALRL